MSSAGASLSPIFRWHVHVARVLWLSCTASVLASGMAFAQLAASASVPAAIQGQFDFINPGARSMGLAGAFIGLADDATAATTNPAGLQRLARQEVSAEGRGWNYFTDFVSGGRFTGVPTNLGIDTLTGPVYGQVNDRVGGVSFLSYVLPRGRWSVAGYRHEASRARGSAVTDGGFFTDGSFGFLQDFREYPSILVSEVNVVNYGGSASVRLGKVFIGGGINLSHLRLDSAQVGYELPSLTVPDFYGPPAYEEPRFGSSQEADDWSPAFTAGMLFVPNDKFQAGASFRRGARFNFNGTFVYPDPNFFELSADYTDEFKVPDNFGAGIAVRPLDGLTVAIDVNRVTYSDLTSFVRSQVRFAPEERDFFSIDDATEVHLGAEYVLTGLRFLPAIRGGFWRESEHSVRYSGSDVLYQPAAALSGDIKHYAIGGGIALNQRVEVNAGFDFSPRVNTMSFSGIFRF